MLVTAIQFRQQKWEERKKQDYVLIQNTDCVNGNRIEREEEWAWDIYIFEMCEARKKNMKC